MAVAHAHSLVLRICMYKLYALTHKAALSVRVIRLYLVINPVAYLDIYGTANILVTLAVSTTDSKMTYKATNQTYAVLSVFEVTRV
jgi:hypothetical protein